MLQQLPRPLSEYCSSHTWVSRVCVAPPPRGLGEWPLVKNSTVWPCLLLPQSPGGLHASASEQIPGMEGPHPAPALAAQCPGSTSCHPRKAAISESRSFFSPCCECIKITNLMGQILLAPAGQRRKWVSQGFHAFQLLQKGGNLLF